MEETKLPAHTATISRNGITISIDHPKSGEGHFTMTDAGTLSIQTDYGSYDAMWNGNLIKFLKDCNVEYVMNNIERSFRNQVSRKKPEGIAPFHYGHLQTLVTCFLEEVKTLPDPWVLKRTECLQPKDGREVILNAYRLKKVKVENEMWYIYYDTETSCFLIAISNDPESVFCIPAEEVAKYLE